MRSNLLRAPVAWIVAAGVLALSVTGCGDEDTAPPEIVSHSAKIASDNALIAEVTVTLDREGPVYVAYENAEAGKFRTATTDESAIEHRVPVLRLRPGTTYSYSVVAVNGEGEETRSNSGTFTTGSLPPALSTLTIDATGTPSSEILLLDHRELEGSYLFMLDGDAQIVWYYESPNPVEDVPYPTGAIVQKPNFNLVYQLNNPFNICCIREITPTGKIVDNLAAGPANGFPHRSLQLMPDGGLLYSAWTYRVIDDTANEGDAETLVEGLALRVWDQETGLSKEIWNAFDGIGTDVRGGWGTGNIASYPNEVTLQEHTPPIRWTGRTRCKSARATTSSYRYPISARSSRYRPTSSESSGSSADRKARSLLRTQPTASIDSTLRSSCPMGTSSCSTTVAIGPRKRAETTPAPWNWPSTTTTWSRARSGNTGTTPTSMPLTAAAPTG